MVGKKGWPSLLPCSRGHFVTPCLCPAPLLTLANSYSGKPEVLVASHLECTHRKWFWIPLCQWPRFLAQRFHTSCILELCLYLNHIVWISFILLHPAFVWEISALVNKTMLGLLCFRSSEPSALKHLTGENLLLNGWNGNGRICSFASLFLPPVRR